MSGCGHEQIQLMGNSFGSHRGMIAVGESSAVESATSSSANADAPFQLVRTGDHPGPVAGSGIGSGIGAGAPDTSSHDFVNPVFHHIWVTNCFHDYTREVGAHMDALPAGTISLREQRLFPEGPLVWNEPRPASDQNAFCLSCHIDSHATPSLQVGVLTANPAYDVCDDPRRQPMQPPARISGTVPAQLYAPDVPPVSDTYSGDGAKQDEWVYPD